MTRNNHYVTTGSSSMEHFFAMDKYGKPGAEPVDATTYDELWAHNNGLKQDATRARLAANTAKMVGHTRGLAAGESDKKIASTLSRTEKAALVVLAATTIIVGANAINNNLDNDRAFHPEQGNPSAQDMPHTQDELPGGNEVPTGVQVVHGADPHNIYVHHP